MLNFSWEPLIHLVKTSGIVEMGQRAWEEAGNDKAVFSYNPDWARYARMEADDVLRWMAIRNEMGALVGYASVIIMRNLHDQSVCCAYVQDMYLEPESRRGFAGVQLLWKLEEQLRPLGVAHITAGQREMVSGDRGGIGKVFEYCGWESRERLWTKNLLKGNA